MGVLQGALNQGLGMLAGGTMLQTFAEKSQQKAKIAERSAQTNKELLQKQKLKQMQYKEKLSTAKLKIAENKMKMKIMKEKT